MPAPVSIFLDFSLPNATTWFYFSFLMSVALFFKFGRVLSMRNWDVVTIFLLVPGLMVVQPPRPAPLTTAQGVVDARHAVLQVVRMVGHGGAGTQPAGLTTVGAVAELADSRDPTLTPPRWQWLGYLWLMVGSGYLFCRCLYDLVLVQRPALAPNLSFGGLAFLAIALLSCLIAVAFRGRVQDPFTEPKADGAKPSKPLRSETATLAQVREWTETRWWLARGSAMTCHLAVVLGLVLIGRRHFFDPAAGMAAATFYLLLPYTGMYVGQLQHVLPTAIVVWAVVVSPWPTLTGFLLGLASGTAYFPALLLPIWFGYYWRRGAGRFLIAFLVGAGATLAIIGVNLWIDGTLDASLRQVLELPDWQPWKMPHSEGFWTGIHAAYRIPVFVVYVVFVLATLVWPMPKNLAQVLALSTGVLIGIQFWYANQGGVYVLWYLPLLVLLVFRPNLAERRPPALDPETDWLCRLRRALANLAMRPIKAAEPVASPTSDGPRRMAG